MAGTSCPAAPPVLRLHVELAWHGRLARLGDANGVAKRIAKRAVDSVEPFGRLLGELDASRAQPLVRPPAILGREDDSSAAGALGHQLADLLGCGVIVNR